MTMPANLARACCLVLLLLLGSCSSLRVDPATGILGTWTTELSGFPVTVIYTDSTVQVGKSAPVAYSLVGEELRFAGGDSQVRVVSFPARAEMLQVDPLTGTSQRYARVTDSR